jgi:4-alpha-glucanotransferase
MTGLNDATPAEGVIKPAYELLAQAPSALIAATLGDSLATQKRPNVPGAPNSSWSFRVT